MQKICQKNIVQSCYNTFSPMYDTFHNAICFLSRAPPHILKRASHFLAESATQISAFARTFSCVQVPFCCCVT